MAKLGAFSPSPINQRTRQPAAPSIVTLDCGTSCTCLICIVACLFRILANSATCSFVAGPRGVAVLTHPLHERMFVSLSKPGRGPADEFIAGVSLTKSHHDVSSRRHRE